VVLRQFWGLEGEDVHRKRALHGGDDSVEELISSSPDWRLRTSACGLERSLELSVVETGVDHG
jgi:hypothetical protein